MSLLMTPTDHYPANHENSPTQATMAYNGSYASMYAQNNQWQQFGRSPTSMGSNSSPSPMNPMNPSSSLNAPAVPSPLLHSTNGMTPAASVSNIPGSHGNMLNSQPSSIDPPMLRSPFEEDIYARPHSRQQMPPPGPSQPSQFELMKMQRMAYYKPMDMNVRARCPFAFNTVASGSFNYNYPPKVLPFLRRTPYDKFAHFMERPMPVPMPPQTTSAPASTSTNKRAKKKKSEPQVHPAAVPIPSTAIEHDLQKQAMVMNGMMSHPNTPYNCVPHDLGTGGPTPDGTNDLSQCNSPTFNNLKGRPTSTDNFSSFPPNTFARPLKLMYNDKFAVNVDCLSCRKLITSDKRGIRCTALGQGCGYGYHPECAGLSPESFVMFLRDPRCEWVCQNCKQQRPILMHS
ncbi:hypothetical protein M3Y98_00293100 [Aphelenchoides besseyi]|nr:hypothetical protein M3Y98_00293100 [Aphelenchoides besseyi]KAI6201151.1 hypothetical protein M3Y96_00810900 [Aphelenchoides besseyi]